MEPTEYQCPYCGEWYNKGLFGAHNLSHRNHPISFVLPDTIEEFKRRYEHLGLYSER